MASNSLYPAAVRINYSSAYSVHSMTLPSVPVLGGDIGVGGYQFTLRGLAAPVNCDAAINDFIDVLKPLMGTDTTFIDYVLFQYATPTSKGVPVSSQPINKVGTGGIITWRKAVQQTWTWRTDEFGIFKMVLLDVPSGNTFDKIPTTAGDARQAALSDYVTAPVTWLAGRDGGRPNTFLQVAVTLNEKLRRAYRMN